MTNKRQLYVVTIKFIYSYFKLNKYLLTMIIGVYMIHCRYGQTDNFSIIFFFFTLSNWSIDPENKYISNRSLHFFFNVCELVIHSLSATSCPFSIVFFSFHFHGKYSQISNSTFQQRTHLRIKLLKVTLKRKFIIQVFHYSITFYNISLSKE